MIRSLSWLLFLALAVVAGGAVFLRLNYLAGITGAVLAGLVLGFLLSSRNRPGETPSSLNVTAGADSHLMKDVFQVAFDEMREALLVVDAQLRVVASNQAARKLFPNLHENDATRLTEITRETAIYEAFTQGITGHQRNAVKVEFYRDGPRSFDLRVVPLPSGNDVQVSGAVGILFDVTRLDRLESVRQEFLSNVSHELRTPLTSIMALAETLQAGAVDDAENNRRFLGIIQKNSKRLQHLLDDILELSTIESGNVTIQRESVGLTSIVDDVVNSLCAKAAARNISIVNEVAINVTVFVDPRRLVQMLTNLIDNAIKFNRENGSINISHQAVGDRDRIHVRDTGEGIPSQHLDRIFERFYRVDRARSRDLGGTGLGLAIVKHLARVHEGEVTVTSRIAEGTEFIIELPRLSEQPK